MTGNSRATKIFNSAFDNIECSFDIHVTHFWTMWHACSFKGENFRTINKCTYIIVSLSLHGRRGKHRWRCNNPFPTYPVFRCLQWIFKPHFRLFFNVIFPSLFCLPPPFFLLSLSPAELSSPCRRIWRYGHATWGFVSSPRLGDHHVLQLHEFLNCVANLLVYHMIFIANVQKSSKASQLKGLDPSSKFGCQGPALLTGIKEGR